MSSYYLNAKLSHYIDARGGRDYLAKLVERDMQPDAVDEPDRQSVSPDGSVTYIQPGDYLGTHEILRR